MSHSIGNERGCVLIDTFSSLIKFFIKRGVMDTKDIGTELVALCRHMEEMSLFTIENGKIVKEEFF